MRILSRWTAQAMYAAWDAGVSRFFWLSLRDSARGPGLPFSRTSEAGLYFRGTTLAGDRPKPMLQAFRFPFVAFNRIDRLFFWGRTPTGGPGRVAIQVQEHGTWRQETVVQADSHGIFTGEVLTPYGRGNHGTVRASCRGETAIPFSLRPVKDFYQPPFG